MRLLAAVAAALLLAGCSGGEDAATTAAATTGASDDPSQTLTAALPPAPAPDTTGSVADAVERVLPSVVSVRTTSFGGGEGESSGVVLDRDGLIVTNNHVVEGTTGISVSFNDDVHEPLEGTVIGTAPERDLAVIRVEADDLVPVALARSSLLRLGDPVIAIGFPLGLGGPTVTAGIVSGLDRTIDGRNGELTGLLQTDAAINPGNSGGPLVDRSGRLVGINTAGVRQGDAENIGFAIAIDGALPVIDRIRRQTPASQAWLGIAYGSVGTDAAAVQLGLDASTRGAAVTVVYPGGPGEEAGLAPGDVITVADDVPIESAADLSRLLAQRKPGDEVDLELIDSRGPRRVAVRVARRTPGALP
ncbi:MAG: S1C family serine protease [Gaiellaceae bacterium]